jgi:hypothetical protein
VGREKGYAEVVAKLNEPTVIQDDFDPVAGFLAAANSSPEGGERDFKQISFFVFFSFLLIYFQEQSF